MIWHILGSISKLMAEVPCRLSFQKCLVASIPLSDYRSDCPVIQVNQESTVQQPHSCHIDLLNHTGSFQQPPSHQEGQEHPQHVPDRTLCSSRKQKVVRQSREAQLPSGLGLGSLSFRTSLQMRYIVPYSLAVVAFNVMFKAQASCSVTAWSDLPFSCG